MADEHFDLCICRECVGQPLWKSLVYAGFLVACLIAIPLLIGAFVP